MSMGLFSVVSRKWARISCGSIEEMGHSSWPQSPLSSYPLNKPAIWDCLRRLYPVSFFSKIRLWSWEAIIRCIMLHEKGIRVEFFRKYYAVHLLDMHFHEVSLCHDVHADCVALLVLRPVLRQISFQLYSFIRPSTPIKSKPSIFLSSR